MPSFDSNGVGLFYHEEGAGNGPIILHVHGLQGNAGIWQRHFGRLSDRYHCVALNNRGRAPSDAPAGAEAYTLDTLADDLHRFIDAQGYSNLTLLGWSMGVSTVLSYLQRHGQEKAVRLILVDGTHAFAKFPGREEPSLSDTTVEAWGETFGPVAADCFEGSLAAIKAADFSDLLPEIRIPAVVFHGREDPIIPWEAGKALSDLIPRATLRTFETSQHAPLVTEPGRFSYETQIFIARDEQDRAAAGLEKANAGGQR